MLGVLAGCGATGPVQLPRDGHPTSDAVVTACRRLVATLPHRVAGQQRREVRPATALAAAWGDPAIVLRCGVARPSELTRTSRCDVVDGVGWFARRVAGAYRFTTIGRRAYVEVRVPDRYAPQADALVDLAHSIQAAVTVVHRCR